MAKNKALDQMLGDVGEITAPGKNTKKTFEVKLGKERFGLEAFCNYKSALMLELLGELSEKIDLAPIFNALIAMSQGEDTKFIWAATVMKLLPQALRQAPQAVTRLAALSLISNKKLAELYDQPNGIAEEIKRVAKLIDFDGEPGLHLKIITEALPYIGLDALKNGLTGLGQALGISLGRETQAPNAG